MGAEKPSLPTWTMLDHVASQHRGTTRGKPGTHLTGAFRQVVLFGAFFVLRPVVQVAGISLCVCERVYS